MLSPTPLRLAALLLSGAILCGCGYRIPGGDTHPDDPFFPGLAGDSGFVVTRLPLAAPHGLEVRLLANGLVEILSEGDLAPGDSLRTFAVQRFDSSGVERERHTRRIVAPSESVPRECDRCSDGRLVLGSWLLLEADSTLSSRRIERFEIDPEWMTRTFGRSLEALQDSVRVIGDSLDFEAKNHFFHPKADSLARRLDSLVFAQAFAYEGIDSLHRVEYGSWNWVLGIDREHRARRTEHQGALANVSPTAVRCSSLFVHPMADSPLRAWDSSVIENSSSGNHFVFGFYPQWMTYHRVRLQGGEARFKIYDHRPMGTSHVRYFLKGAATLPHSVWIVAGGTPREDGSTSPDSLFQIRRRSSPH